MNMLFIDLRQLSLADRGDVERVRAEVERRLHGLGGRAHAIVNCRGLRIESAVLDDFHRMLAGVEAKFDMAITGYGTPQLLEVPVATRAPRALVGPAGGRWPLRAAG